MPCRCPQLAGNPREGTIYARLSDPQPLVVPTAPASIYTTQRVSAQARPSVFLPVAISRVTFHVARSISAT